MVKLFFIHDTDPELVNGNSFLLLHESTHVDILMLTCYHKWILIA